MSVFLRKSWVVVLAILAGSALLTSVAFAASTSISCDNDYRVDEIERINFEAEVIPASGVEYEITAVIDGDCEVDYSVVGSSLEDVMDASVEELNDSSITFNKTITREDLSNKIYGSDGNLVRYFANYSDLSFSDISDITIQPADKTGSVSAYIDFEDESHPLVITLSYSAYPSLNSFISEVDTQLRTEHQLGGSFDEDDLLAIADIDIDFDEFGENLQDLSDSLAEIERCEEFNANDITSVSVSSVNVYLGTDKVTVSYLDGCEYSYETRAYKVDSDDWKKYLIEEIVNKLNNSQYRINPAITYTDIAEVIDFGDNYPNDPIPEVDNTETSDTESLRAQLMRLIEMLQQLLQLQSLLGR